jgi:hypothetical protein
MESLAVWLSLVVSALSLGVSATVAVVQFSGDRPVLDLEPDARHRDPDDWMFILRIRNGTPSAIQIRRCRFRGSKSKLIAPTPDVEDMVEQMNSGTVNLWIEAGQKVELHLRVEKDKRLSLDLYWRRLSGRHLTSRLPLFIRMSPDELTGLKRAQTEVPLMHAGRRGR